MTNQKRKYDSTVARIAGNVAGAILDNKGLSGGHIETAAYYAVRLARAIVDEVQKSELAEEPAIDTRTITAGWPIDNTSKAGKTPQVFSDEVRKATQARLERSTFPHMTHGKGSHPDD